MSGCNGLKTGYNDFDGDHIADDSDCKPDNPEIYPGAPETTGDGVDSNCDGSECKTEDQITSYYVDTDLDGYYSLLTGQPALCPDEATAQGYLVNDSTIEDVNNDGVIDEADLDYDDSNADINIEKNWYIDNDGDGYGDAESEAVSDYVNPDENVYVDNNQDPDDTDANTYPDAPEICDGKDNDGNGEIDETFEFAQTTVNADADGDGYGDPAGETQDVCETTAGYVAITSSADEDCDDTDASVNPNGDETCNGIDDDCDGAIDSVDSDITSEDTETWYADADGDGFADVAGLTSTDPDIVQDQCDSPGDGWIAGSSIEDVNGDGTIDNDDFDANDTNASVKPDNVWYKDSDGDGFGDASEADIGNYAPVGYVADSSDWDDTDSTLNPATVFYKDADGDGYGNTEDAGTSGFTSDPRTGLPDGYVTNNSDADDEDENSYPGASVRFDLKDTDQDNAPDSLTPSSSAVYTINGPAASEDFAYAATTLGDWNHDGEVDVCITDRKDSTGGIEAGAIFCAYGPITASGTFSDTGTSSSGGFKLTGEAGSQFGASTASGDLDDDGYDDLVVGALTYTDGSVSSAGANYLLFGPLAVAGAALSGSYTVESTTFDSSYSVIVGDITGRNQGYRNKTGDVNGDGVVDLSVSTDLVTSAPDEAYLYLGSTTLDWTSPDFTFSSENNGDRLRIGTIGDADGDGFEEVGLSAVDYDGPAGSNSGAVYLINGASSGPDTENPADATVIFEGDAANDQIGNVLYTANGADVDGDGYDDLLFGVPNQDDNGTDAGTIYGYYGKSSLTVATLSPTSHSDFYILGNTTGDQLGSAYSTALSDPTGDGADRAVFSARYYDSSDLGQTYILDNLTGATGTYSLSDLAIEMLTGETANAMYSSVAEPIDTDADGRSDTLLLGSTETGSVQLFGWE